MSLARFLHEEGIFVNSVIPKLIKDYGSNSLRKVKTDKADTRKIARYGLDNWTELHQHTPMDTIRMQLKTLNRQQGLYSKTKTMMKITSLRSWIRPIPVSTPCLTALSVRTAATAQPLAALPPYTDMVSSLQGKIGGFCRSLLVCGLCAGHKPRRLYRALLQVV